MAHQALVGAGVALGAKDPLDRRDEQVGIGDEQFADAPGDPLTDHRRVSGGRQATWRRTALLQPRRHRGRVLAGRFGNLADGPALASQCDDVHVLLLGQHGRWLPPALGDLAVPRLEGPPPNVVDGARRSLDSSAQSRLSVTRNRELRLPLTNRARKVRTITAFMERYELGSVLLVGVSDQNRSKFENLVERGIARHAESVMWSGLAETSSYHPYTQANALTLPFEDNAFDIVVSNAVIEHVGDEAAQRRFVAEHARVGRH